MPSSRWQRLRATRSPASRRQESIRHAPVFHLSLAQTPKSKVALIRAASPAPTQLRFQARRRDMMDTGARQTPGIDTVEIARIERLVRETAPDDLTRFFTPQSWATAATVRVGRRVSPLLCRRKRAAAVPARGRAGHVAPADFVARDNYGAPQVVCSPDARASRSTATASARSSCRSPTIASASAVALPSAPVDVPAHGRFIYRFLRCGAKFLENLRRVFGQTLPEGNRPARAGAPWASVSSRRRVPAFSLALDPAEARAGARRKRRGLSPRAIRGRAS